jgi:DNA repair exonuclease SbcCD ATPase subunit
MRGQQECYICGSSQSYIRYYMKSGIFFLLLLGTFAVLGYWYIDKKVKQTELDKTLIVDTKMQAVSKRIQELEEQLEQAKQTIQQVEANTAQSSETASTEKLKFAEAEKRASKAEERAGWLSKENRRFKAKVKELTDKISAAKNVPVVTNNSAQKPANSKLISLKQELAKYEGQKQVLFNNISTKKKQLEASWQQISGSNAVPSAETVAQREKQVEQATAADKNQVLLLDGQIEAVKKKILVIEGGS